MTMRMSDTPHSGVVESTIRTRRKRSQVRGHEATQGQAYGGFGVVGLFILTWLAALLIWRFARIEENGRPT